MDYNAVLEAIIPLARQAGELALDYFDNPLMSESKSTSVDIVTEADREIEHLITKTLLAQFPDYHLVGEEGGGSGAPAESAPYFWYVDPIDGTTNFAAGIPHYCTSIALADRDANPLVGVIYDPEHDELFTALKGGGALLNDKPMHVTDAETLQQSILASGFHYDRQTNPDNNAAEWTTFIPLVRGLRRFGAAALDLAWVAAGRFDGYWERGLNRWDTMAGVLLIHEAGGIVTDYQGNDHPQHHAEGRYVASNGKIHTQMIDTIRIARER